MTRSRTMENLGLVRLENLPSFTGNVNDYRCVARDITYRGVGNGYQIKEIGSDNSGPAFMRLNSDKKREYSPRDLESFLEALNEVLGRQRGLLVIKKLDRTLFRRHHRVRGDVYTQP